MFEIFYRWSFETRGPVASDPIEFTAGPEDLEELSFYTCMAEELARQETSVHARVAADAAQLLGYSAPPPRKNR